MTHDINQIGTGALLAMIIFGIMYVLAYLARAWRNRPPYATIPIFYSYANKAAFALLTTFTGFAVKTGAGWWSAVLIKHGADGTFALLEPMAVVGTGLSLWGIVCLLRSLTPYEWRHQTWLVLAIGAVIFGILFAL